MPRINQKNFAINERCYNIENQQPYLPPEAFNMQSSDDFNTQAKNMSKVLASINSDTAMGQSWLH